MNYPKEAIEKIIEKQIDPVVRKMVVIICMQEFSSVFKHFCDNPVGNDTTLGATYRELARICEERIKPKMNEMIEKTESQIYKETENPFMNTLIGLFYLSLDYYNLKETIWNFISYEWSEKQASLFECGIIDQEGDYNDVRYIPVESR